jgi:hypothetical protein
MSSHLPYKYQARCECGNEILATIPTEPNDRHGQRVRCAACDQINWAECQGAIVDE